MPSPRSTRIRPSAEETAPEAPAKNAPKRRAPRKTSKKDSDKSPLMPVVPLRGMVAFPAMVLPLFIGRPKSIEAVQAAANSEKLLFLTAQRDEETEEPGGDDVYQIGIVAEIAQWIKLPDGNLRVVVEGRARARALRFDHSDAFFSAEIVPFEEEVADKDDPQTEALLRHLRDNFENAVNLSKKIPPEAMQNASETAELGALADLVVSYLEIEVPERQALLEEASEMARAQQVAGLLTREISVLELDREIEAQVKEGISENQREYFLRERLKSIQEKLGERDPNFGDAQGLRERIEAAQMPPEAHEKATYELERLERMPPMAPEVGMVRNYLELMCDLPWDKSSEDVLDLNVAQETLDEDHYALGKIKERILEFLAVRMLNPDSKGPILCFMGPPGVGKTSIGKSIAKSLGREFVRISVGGIHDEAEIRGHRRTYIGSMAGRIITALKKCKVKNPVFLLDEIDKLGHDHRGDPSSALLEALDPEQNNAFADHYLEVPFDLSQVMFIATGNLLDPIQPALRDRMEVLQFPGYTEAEKTAIATGFLVPKQMKENGVTGDHIEIAPDALAELIRGYTREAGVRNLEREIGTVCRKVARRVAQSGAFGPPKTAESEAETTGKTTRAKKKAADKTPVFETVKVTAETLKTFLGPRRYSRDLGQDKDEIGVAQGLAWTEVGGEVLPIEVLLTLGTGNVKQTGNLGQVMKESCDAAMTYARAHALELGIEADFAAKHDAHIHVPSGGVPKDGPSAGVAITVALVSAMSGRPARKEVAMTGEISLRGHVMPVGGVKEKILAAHRVGAKEIILPLENERDLEELAPEVRDSLIFHPVDRLNQALELALYPLEEAAQKADKSDLSDADKELIAKSENEPEPLSDLERNEEFEIPELKVEKLDVEEIETGKIEISGGKAKKNRKK
ncbi:ATP-dependent Lon peptidase, MEROPS family S16 [Abditibacterium utsteinense]|uniref:Lon protease n=1 Tax=Abditibacterium utsteinense TaxID=1960156 RepID=A0A2S8SUF4_9BACT|nr:endopeptidase La [Abditibacterium utsteinense]PQV64433.1 ATP-dependent Lon peptidase, MEROPS family S16 [Abditibacterium utsteinense]